MHLHIWWILPRSLYLVRLQSCAMGTSERWSHDVDPMWWWVTLPETASPALEFSGPMLVSERVVALWSRGFLNDKWPGCLSSKNAATTYIHLWFVGPNCPMASFHQLRLWSQWWRCLWRFFPVLRKKGDFFLKEEDHLSTERCAIKKYDEICTYCHYIKDASCSINTSLSL